jgi:hypothetical protein
MAPFGMRMESEPRLPTGSADVPGVWTQDAREFSPFMFYRHDAIPCCTSASRDVLAQDIGRPRELGTAWSATDDRDGTTEAMHATLDGRHG